MFSCFGGPPPIVFFLIRYQFLDKPGKSKLDVYRPEIEALLNHGSTQKFIAARYQVTEATLSNRIKKHHLDDVRSVFL